MCGLSNELHRPAGGRHHQALDRPAQKTSPLPRVFHFNSVRSRFQQDRAKLFPILDSIPAAELFFNLVTKAADTNV